MSAVSPQPADPAYEAQVADYLAAHPDFFLRHLELLESLRIPHAVGAGVTSLIERQLAQLRSRNLSLLQRLHELIDVARANDRLSSRMHQLALTLIETRELDELLLAIARILRDEFEADAVSLRLAARPLGTCAVPGVFVSALDLDPLRGLLEAAKPLCGPLETELAQALFADAGVASAALVPLHGGLWEGVLAVGARDVQRFGPGLGTLFLQRIAALLEQALDPHLDTPVD